jgi:DNA polymerase
VDVHRDRDEREGSAVAYIPDRPTLAALQQAAASCRACPLWESGTQTVFGEGPPEARVLLVGEQPGDVEDQTGRPFVGSAGKLLDRALAAAGIDRAQVYVTNAVKHFKWAPSGKRRLHQKPNAREVGACLPWLDAEIDVLRPEVVVAMGATAAQALLGRGVRVTRDRGRFLPFARAPYATVTIHPSAILRARSDEERHAAMAGLVADLNVVAGVLGRPRS